MDIVYVVRDGEDHDALKWSLRSLKNIPHDDVYIIGHKPEWVKNVKYIERFQRVHTKFQNITKNIYMATKIADISDDFIYFDEDMFVMRPIEDVPYYHRGDIQLMIDFYKEQNSAIYVKGLEDVKARLIKAGIERPFSYELHVPIIFNKSQLKEVLELDNSHALNTDIFHVRSFYGNYFNVGGQHLNDVKVHFSYQNRLNWMMGKRYLSSSGTGPDGVLLKHLKELFPRKSRYE